ncbi:putative carbonic anhydrase 5 [Orchesella cincta]|uniref:Putative carbonic anhydrase 5 n=1 Tax=Orchesella cincta TaxID=48709 RepID=A0A1D2M103_ORCCI|nr:putative carbonic anhydrase 5 [Orchesella cincta]
MPYRNPPVFHIDLPFALPHFLHLSNSPWIATRGHPSEFRILDRLSQLILVELDLPGFEPHSLPDPTTGQIRQYTFASAHFHWGQTDLGGSEHCINGKCAAMELHLVHFLAKLRFSSFSSPIVRHLKDVGVPNNATFTVVNEPLDFTPMLKDTAPLKLPVDVYTYKGSLTTPECNEQVNWSNFSQVFCYSDGSCGPATAIVGWRACQTGSRQSPIDLPYFPLSVLASTDCPQSEKLPGLFFPMQNNGHTVQVDFNGAGPSAYCPRPFPDPITRNKEIRVYTFASAHFHWGRSDLTGLNIAPQGKCTAMELHLVHYLSSYGSRRIRHVK